MQVCDVHAGVTIDPLQVDDTSPELQLEIGNALPITPLEV